MRRGLGPIVFPIRTEFVFGGPVACRFLLTYKRSNICAKKRIFSNFVNMTALYSDIIFGPIHSRRLGLSLGVNLLPTQSKLCSFDCIYCECGWNAEHPGARRFNSREDVRTMLGATLRQMVSEGTPPDVITFAGNGEPTMHPDFEAIIDDTIVLRDEICPSARISVLSNATQIGRERAPGLASGR